MSKRKSLSKKLRFEVLKRDRFTCQYCSAKPPKVPLEIDHIDPVSRGGTNDIDNLVTACFDCNRGKSNNRLDSIPDTLIEKSECKRLAQQQYDEYKKLLNKETRQLKKNIKLVENIFSDFFEDYSFTIKFEISVKQFIKNLGVDEVEDAMEKACIKMNNNPNNALKYFCGICWNKIKEHE